MPLLYVNRFSIETSLTVDQVAELVRRSIGRPRVVAWRKGPRYQGTAEGAQFRLRNSSWTWRLDGTLRPRRGGTSLEAVAGVPLTEVVIPIIAALALVGMIYSWKGFVPWRSLEWPGAFVGLALNAR